MKLNICYCWFLPKVPLRPNAVGRRNHGAASPSATQLRFSFAPAWINKKEQFFFKFVNQSICCCLSSRLVNESCVAIVDRTEEDLRHGVIHFWGFNLASGALVDGSVWRQSRSTTERIGLQVLREYTTTCTTVKLWSFYWLKNLCAWLMCADVSMHYKEAAAI